jgi:hypothetical protein
VNRTSRIAAVDVAFGGSELWLTRHKRTFGLLTSCDEVSLPHITAALLGAHSDWRGWMRTPATLQSNCRERQSAQEFYRRAQQL